jgi:transcriptional regulator with PAS, ATPase and Fis domain
MVTERLIEQPTLIGQSARIKQVQRLIEKLGRGKWPALILGETGTGKEVVAKAIHQASPPGPFVTIDCSSFVGPLMESELFGHVKGAFTGSIGQKIGLIEHANGGTAFFDEIGELPLDLQAKLLRVLQEKEFRPVGSVHQKKSDFRIIAATNRDLPAEVEKGTFRRDLYYRLNVVNVRLAPLRERKEDIPSLVNHFLHKYGGTHSLTNESLEAVLSYNWPGNVRELENCIQQMVAIHTGPLLHRTNLPSPLLNHLTHCKPMAMAAAVGGFSMAVPAQGGTVSLSPIMKLIEMERREIFRALEYTKGDRVTAASLLGIGRTTLYRKIKEYEIAC